MPIPFFFPDTNIVHVPPVTVTAGLTHLSPARTPFSIAVLEPEDLRAQPVRAVSDALAYVPGVDLRQRGPLGIQSDVSIRGGTFEQTAVMLDGLRLNDIQTGHNTWSLPVLPSDIERIEVVKGGSARFFGAGALDGAVNIVLKPASNEPSLTASIVGGDATFYEGRLSASVGTGAVGHQISAQIMHTGGWAPNTDASLQSALYRAAMPVGDGSATFIVGANNKEFGANGYYTPNFPEQWEHVTTVLGGFTLETPIAEELDLTVRALARGNEDEFRLKRDDPSFYTNTHTTQQYLVQTGLRWRHDITMTSVLFEGGHDGIQSSNLGTHDRLRGNIMIEEALQLNNVRVSAGFGALTFSDRVPLMTGGIEASIAFEPTERTIDLVYVSAQRSGRIPTYTDLYYSDPQTLGDSTLTPEHAFTLEGGFRRTSRAYTLQAAVYRRDGRDLIDYVVLDNGMQQAANITRVVITGVDVSAQWNVRTTVLSSIRLGFTYQDVASSSSETTRFVADNLRTQGIVDTRWTLPFDVDATYMIRVLERVTDPTVHVVHDVRVQRTFGMFTPMLEITNITSEAYIETGWVTVPPRWARVGVQVAW